MGLRGAIFALMIVTALPLVAQDPPPTVPPPTVPSPTFPPAGAPDPQPAAPQGPPILENTGKPIVVPFQCTEEDIRLGGLPCSDDAPCPVYLELSTMESPGIRLFTAGNIHTASATLFSIVLGSDDNGHTW